MQLTRTRAHLVPVAAAARPAAGAPRPAVPFTPVRPAARSNQRSRRLEWRQKAEPEAAPEPAGSTAPAASEQAAAAEEPETVFYEGSGSNVELALSVLLGATLLFLPLTIASIGRRLWIKYRFTNKRVVVITNSPILKREVQVEYKKIKEIRSAPRAFGAWGDVVIFLKDGSRLPLAGLERYQEIVDYMEGFIQ